MKKTIGICTHTGIWVLNYGSVMQMTALQQLFKLQGYNAVSAAFYGNNSYKSYTLGRIKKSIETLGISWFRTFIKFYIFLKHQHVKMAGHIGIFQSENEVVKYAEEHFDYLCCGSDAIWRHQWASDFYFWNYSPKLNKLPHFSYAPSIQSRMLEYDHSEILRDFVAISVRETKGAELLAPYTDKRIAVVLDPVLTIDEQYWHKACKKRLVNEPYIVCYFIDLPEKNYISLQKIKEKYALSRIIYINTDIVDKGYGAVYSYYHGDVYKKPTGPREFLSLFKYASAVCTDSFHGTCFSIVFRKDFYFMKRNGEDFGIESDYRILDIMERLNTGNRIITSNEQIASMPHIDYTKVETALASEREASLNYLQDALCTCDNYEKGLRV